MVRKEKGVSTMQALTYTLWPCVGQTGDTGLRPVTRKLLKLLRLVLLFLTVHLFMQVLTSGF